MPKFKLLTPDSPQDNDSDVVYLSLFANADKDDIFLMATDRNGNLIKGGYILNIDCESGEIRKSVNCRVPNMPVDKNGFIIIK
jgi:maltose-binding protein MalE